MPEILPVARALEAAAITGEAGGEAWRDRMDDLHGVFRAAVERVELAPGWTVDSATDWAWARVQPSGFDHLVGERGWAAGGVRRPHHALDLARARPPRAVASRRPMIPTEREIDQIAEYADASVRGATRRGSLAPIRGRHGVNAWLYAKWGNRGNAIYTFTGGLLTIALSGVIAWLVEEPLVFPSLGATAFLFFETPMAEVASPRNTIIGHGVGAAIAFGWLLVFGLTDAPSALESGFTLERAAAVALSVGCTGGILGCSARRTRRPGRPR